MIFIDIVILLYKLATTDLKCKSFFKKLGKSIAQTFTSQISGNLVRELLSLVLSIGFGPVLTSYVGIKFGCWLLEVGTSIVLAHSINKRLDPSAYSAYKYLK